MTSVSGMAVMPGVVIGPVQSPPLWLVLCHIYHTIPTPLNPTLYAC